MTLTEQDEADGLYPCDLERLPTGGVRITWSDQVSMEYSPQRLRHHCPCATCREKKRAQPTDKPAGLPVLTAAETAPLEVTTMRPVGHYAYNIVFSDGHSSGIFPFTLLREIGESS